MSHAVIIGGGVVGCANAYALSRLGYRVSVIDSHNSAAQGCSKANAGQLSYQFVEPLASPQTLKSIPQLLLNKSSPVHWKPRADQKHIAWLLDFLKACRSNAFHSHINQQIKLALHSQNTFKRWTDDNKKLLEHTHHSTSGKIVIYGPKNSKKRLEAALKIKGTLDQTQFLIDAEHCKALEPALSHRCAAELSFGVWTPSESVIDGAQWAMNLLSASQATPFFGQTASQLNLQSDGKIVVGLSSGDTVVADHVLIAAGLSTPKLLQQWRIPHRLKLEGLRGCSLTVPVIDPERALRISITEADHKIVYSRIGAQLRIAGFADVGHDEQVTPTHRFQQLREHLHQQGRDTIDMSQSSAWYGFRPSTPSSLPCLGRLRGKHSLWINAGHGALGLTLAVGCADLLAKRLSVQHHSEVAAIYAAPSWLA